MNTETFKETLKRELPALIRTDPNLRLYLLELTRSEYADRLDTQDRFHQILAELRQDRAIEARKWEEHNRQWEEYVEEQNHKFEEYVQEQNCRWEEQNRKFEEYVQEQNSRWEEQNNRWEEQNRKWEEQNRKLDEHIQENSRKWEANYKELIGIKKANAKLERTLGAIGARWGMKSERSFRKALAGILEENFGVQVLNVNEYDDTGEVFGRPDQIELDIIIKNGLLLICELKSSMDKSGIYFFERKARFYEKRHQRTANRLIVISPMVNAKAQELADSLGIEVFSDVSDVADS